MIKRIKRVKIGQILKNKKCKIKPKSNRILYWNISLLIT